MRGWFKFLGKVLVRVAITGFVVSWLISIGGWCMSQASDMFVVVGYGAWLITAALIGYTVMKIGIELITKLEVGE